jgi:hypothetical protein
MSAIELFFTALSVFSFLFAVGFSAMKIIKAVE